MDGFVSSKDLKKIDVDKYVKPGAYLYGVLIRGDARCFLCNELDSSRGFCNFHKVDLAKDVSGNFLKSYSCKL